MIRNILLPEKIGTYRLFAQRTLNIMMHDNHIRGAVVLLKPQAAIVEKLIEIPLIQGTDEALARSPQEALQAVIAEAGKVDNICVVIPTTFVVIKELDVPFLDPDKIRLVIEYEMEPLLPFSLEEAIVDFVIMKSSKELQSSQVLAAAIRKQDLQNILDVYEQAGIKVQRVIIDLLTTYGLYERIPAYYDLPGGTALVDVGLHGTRITFLQNNQLKLTRYIAKGLDLLISHISEEAALSTTEVRAHLEEHGVSLIEGPTPLEKIIQKHVINFFNEIQFTLNSFSLKLNYYDGVSKILFLGKAATIPHLIEYSTELLQIPTEIFDPTKIFQVPSIKKRITSTISNWGAFINQLGASLGPIGFENFNLRRKELALFDADLAFKQLAGAITLFTLTLLSIGFLGYSHIAELRQTAKTLEDDQVSRLKALLPQKERGRTLTLPALTRKIEDIVKEKNTLWAPFGQERTKPLEILLEVTQTFDKKQFSLDIEELTLSEKETGNPLIELEGYFRSEKGLGYHHKEWAELEERIKESPLLTFVEPPSPIPAAEKGIKFSVKLQKKRGDGTTGGQG